MFSDAKMCGKHEPGNKKSENQIFKIIQPENRGFWKKATAPHLMLILGFLGQVQPALNN